MSKQSKQRKSKPQYTGYVIVEFNDTTQRFTFKATVDDGFSLARKVQALVCRQ